MGFNAFEALARTTLWRRWGGRDDEFLARLLAIVAVDEPIYRRLPGFLIATVDKFAALPWISTTRGLLTPKTWRFDSVAFDPGCDLIHP